jgi:hypothetical protein
MNQKKAEIALEKITTKCKSKAPLKSQIVRSVAHSPSSSKKSFSTMIVSLAILVHSVRCALNASSIAILLSPLAILLGPLFRLVFDRPAPGSMADPWNGARMGRSHCCRRPRGRGTRSENRRNARDG